VPQVPQVLRPVPQVLRPVPQVPLMPLPLHRDYLLQWRHLLSYRRLRLLALQRLGQHLLGQLPIVPQVL
jgi:hypothetical protein